MPTEHIPIHTAECEKAMYRGPRVCICGARQRRAAASAGADPRHSCRQGIEPCAACEGAAAPAGADPEPEERIEDWGDGMIAVIREPDPRRAQGGPSLDYEALRMERGWPTPAAMRSAADALDNLVIPKYGDVLRWVADLCDDALAARLGVAPEPPE